MRALGGCSSALILLCGCGSPVEPGGTPRLVFGRSGVGPLEFNYPRAAVIGAEDLLWVVDKAGRIQCLTLTGQYVREWRMPQIDAGKPTGLGAGRDGRIYVADTHYHRVMVFDASGRLVEQFGGPGTGPGQFLLPTDVAEDEEGRVYVSEYGGNDRISRFASAREYEFSFGGRDAGPGRLERPQSLTLDADGTLWVADACNHRVVHFDRRGRFLGAFGQLGSGRGEVRFPYNVEVLSDGTLVVCEYGNNRVQRFDRSGRSLGCWGGAGREPGRLAYPWAVAVDRDDRIYVIDSGNNRVQVIDGRSPRTWR